MYRYLIIASVILLGLTACTVTPERPRPETVDPLSQAAADYRQQGDYLAAAQLYLSEAKTAPENQRAEYRLKAAELLAQGEHWAQLEQVLAGINRQQLSLPQAARFSLLSAQTAVANRQPEQALAALGEISSPENLPDLGRQYYQLRADAYALAGNPLEAARQLIWLDGLLDDPQQKLDNQYRLWEQLSVLSSESLEALKTSPPPDPLSGWMELVLITREYRGDRDRWSEELSRWRTRYPRHAAEEALLPDLLYQVGQFAATANRIAVLLPLNGRTQASAEAIRDGILAAFYGSRPPKPQLRFYDTGADEQLIWSVYQQAVSEGADFVIGPLLKPGIDQLARSGHLPVPVLALNQVGESPESGELPLYQFGLAPEDEARQAAERAFADGHQQMVALAPDSAWGARVLEAFSMRFSELGGEVLSSERYPSKGADFANPIQRVMNLDGSKRRHQALQRLLGQKLNYEPRRRQDAEAVFILAFPQQARQIKPQLKFHHAGDLPVYGTSHLYQAGSDASMNRDMDGLMFCDIPWVLGSQGNWAGQRENLHALWPSRSLRYQRLYALGFDAYQVIPWLETLHLPGFSQFQGATGILTIDSEKRLHRTLEWARFNKGVAEKMMSMEGRDEQETDRR